MRITSRRCSLADLLAGNEPADRLFRVAFGSRYLPTLERSLGAAFEMLELWESEPPARLAAMFPVSAEESPRLRWAEMLSPLSPATAAALRAGDALVMDFAAVSPAYRGRMKECFPFAVRDLARRGFGAIVSEIQWLKQLVYWRELGWRPFAPLSLDPAALRVRVAASLAAGVAPETALPPGHTFFWHSEPFYAAAPRWNVVLPEPVLAVRTLPPPAS